jgi:hypothetical protein
MDAEETDDYVSDEADLRNFHLTRRETTSNIDLYLAIMAGIKRRHGEELSDTVYSNKSRSRPSIEARVDPTYGQRSAIPGLDDDTTMEGEEDDLTYDEEMDALAYLRSVRLVNFFCDYWSKDELG